ncbi:conserved hypothetical protein [Candidatus Desulfosporosinus infrequens]|uniref:Uncharacterized protein n=1 Tax=Candidatus Desulfosporosinus infrequens TaxID=2043169 RepID=A0A2U3LQB7_9FIRM|nr:conserved hypothetical protein [Candidatus Desulfosporosinus infrequens]
MEKKDTLSCETCGKTHHDTPIIEKPFKLAFYSDVMQLQQNTGDYRKQENICLDCLQIEINSLKKQCKTRVKIT